MTIDLFQRPGAPAYRNPLMSLDVVKFMASLPPNLQLRPDCDRPLQRAAMKGILPEETRLRQDKCGSDPAFFLGLRTSPEWYAVLTERPRIAERGYVDLTRWREAVDQFCVGYTADMGAFLTCCALEVWLQSLEQYRLDGPADILAYNPEARDETGRESTV